jgi:hypothetical protein
MNIKIVRPKKISTVLIAGFTLLFRAKNAEPCGSLVQLFLVFCAGMNLEISVYVSTTVKLPM